jgi:hypothetical protein
MTEIRVVHEHTKRGTYVRRFDHDEARRRRDAGESGAALAREYGVTPAAIYQATHDAQQKAHMTAYGAAWRTTTCEDCGGPAMKLTGSKAHSSKDGAIVCLKCRSVRRRKTLRFSNGVLVAVRCSSRDCATGERWQTPDNFSRGTRFKDVRPGGIHKTCRACQTKARTLYRQAHKVPCVQCGQPCLPASERGTRQRHTPTGLCLGCYRETLRGPRKAAA